MAYYTAADFPTLDWRNLQGYTPQTLPTWVERKNPLAGLWDDDDDSGKDDTLKDVIEGSDKASDIAAGRIHHPEMYDADDMWVGAEGTGYGMKEGVMTEVTPAGGKQWGGTDYKDLPDWSKQFGELLANNNVAKLTRFLNKNLFSTKKQDTVKPALTRSLSKTTTGPFAYPAGYEPDEIDYSSAFYPEDEYYDPEKIYDWEDAIPMQSFQGLGKYKEGLLYDDIDQVVNSLLSPYAIETALPNAASSYTPANYVEQRYKNTPSETTGWVRKNAFDAAQLASASDDPVANYMESTFDWAGSSPAVEVDTGAIDDDENDDAYAGMLEVEP